MTDFGGKEEAPEGTDREVDKDSSKDIGPPKRVKVKKWNAVAFWAFGTSSCCSPFDFKFGSLLMILVAICFSQTVITTHALFVTIN